MGSDDVSMNLAELFEVTAIRYLGCYYFGIVLEGLMR